MVVFKDTTLIIQSSSVVRSDHMSSSLGGLVEGDVGGSLHTSIPANWMSETGVVVATTDDTILSLMEGTPQAPDCARLTNISYI